MPSDTWTIGTTLGTAAAWVAALAAWVALVVEEYRRRQSRKTDIRVRYQDLKSSRDFFWTVVRAEYSRFRTMRPAAPQELKALVGSAGMVPDIVQQNGRPLIQWLNENVLRLNSDQRTLWEFVTAIYPPREGRQGKVTDFSCISSKEGKEFHRARGDLANFWDTWAGVLSTRYLAREYKAAAYDFVLLSWFDVALKQWTPEVQDVGKNQLYRLASVCEL